MKWFKGTIQDTDGQLEEAVALPGWSHAGPSFESGCSWYPFKSQFRHIYFRAKNWTVAQRQLGKSNLYVRDVCEV